MPADRGKHPADSDKLTLSKNRQSVSPFYLIGHLVAFPLCFCISGIAVWKIFAAMPITIK